MSKESTESKIAAIEAKLDQMQFQITDSSQAAIPSNGSENTFPTWFESGGGGDGWTPFFSVSLGPEGGEAANLVGVGAGLVEHAGVGRFETLGAYVAVTAAATESVPHYFIGRYKYSDNTIAFVVRSTAPMTEINDYFEWQLCEVWLNTSGAANTAVAVGPFGSGPVRIGGVLL